MTSVPNENKENVLPEPPKREIETIVMAAHHGRTALGEQKTNIVVGNPGCMVVKPSLVHKRPLDSNKENQPAGAPVVPVAQFEAFKVYEDNYEDRMARIEEQLKQKIKPGDFFQVYKGTAEDRFYTKSEVLAMERKRREEEYARFLRAQGSPMSTDKSYEGDVVVTAEEELLLRGSRNTDESLFEVKEYRDDIYKYLRTHELQHRPKPGYMKKQPDVTSSMRCILVDWLVEVAEEYSLHTETLYLAVNYIDRFLSYMSVVRAKLQLVGTSALFLASKYEEITPPSIADFVYITDDTYTKKQVIRMEHLILKVLNFDLSVPTPLTFIRAMCAGANQTSLVKNLAMYLSELCLLNSDVYMEFVPSVLAASSIAVARHNLNLDAWSKKLMEMTGYELKELKASVEFITYMFKMAPTMAQQAIREKYKAKKYLQVSQLEQREEPVDFVF